MDQHLVYHRATGSLYYDRDGKGGDAMVLIATLTTKPIIDSSDIFLV